MFYSIEKCVSVQGCGAQCRHFSYVLFALITGYTVIKEILEGANVFG